MDCTELEPIDDEWRPKGSGDRGMTGEDICGDKDVGAGRTTPCSIERLRISVSVSRLGDVFDRSGCVENAGIAAAIPLTAKRGGEMDGSNGRERDASATKEENGTAGHTAEAGCRDIGESLCKQR
jgi:hypothetical protein